LIHLSSILPQGDGHIEVEDHNNNSFFQGVILSRYHSTISSYGHLVSTQKSGTEKAYVQEEMFAGCSQATLYKK